MQRLGKCSGGCGTDVKGFMLEMTFCGHCDACARTTGCQWVQHPCPKCGEPSVGFRIGHGTHEVGSLFKNSRAYTRPCICERCEGTTFKDQEIQRVQEALHFVPRQYHCATSAGLPQSLNNHMVAFMTENRDDKYVLLVEGKCADEAIWFLYIALSSRPGSDVCLINWDRLDGAMTQSLLYTASSRRYLVVVGYVPNRNPKAQVQLNSILAKRKARRKHVAVSGDVGQFRELFAVPSFTAERTG